MIQSDPISAPRHRIAPDVNVINEGRNGDYTTGFKDFFEEYSTAAADRTAGSSAALPVADEIPPDAAAPANPEKSGKKLPPCLPGTGSTDRRSRLAKHGPHADTDAVPVSEDLDGKGTRQPTELIPVADAILGKSIDPVPVMPLPEGAAAKPQIAFHAALPELADHASDQARTRIAAHRAQAAQIGLTELTAEQPAAANAELRLGQPPHGAVAPAAEEVRLAISLPRAATTMTAIADPWLAPPTDDSAAPQIGLPTPHSGQGHQGPSQFSGEVSALRPQEFTALIDRLSAAREALAPQTVSISVAHHDFGPVRLHFRTDEAGLAVAMTSPDPEFARAAAAIAPVLPTMASEQAGSALQNRGESAAGQPGGFTQPRGQSSERRQDHGQHQSHSQSEQSPPRPANDQAPHSGIYA